MTECEDVDVVVVSPKPLSFHFPAKLGMTEPKPACSEQQLINISLVVLLDDFLSKSRPRARWKRQSWLHTDKVTERSGPGPKPWEPAHLPQGLHVI